MGNSWFQFREFRIEQGRSAMKVCTDSCIFGALAADRESRLQVPPSRILDLGCGTGLLSLMMAQAFPAARISGIELHPGSAADCRENFASSLWRDRLHIEELDFHLMPSDGEKFDCIICNPPFFLNHLLSPQVSRNAAMHIDSEGLVSWLQFMENCLAENGRIWMLLDRNAAEKIRGIAAAMFIKEEEWINFLTADAEIRRSVLCLSHKGNPGFSVENQLVFEKNGKISPWAESLLEAYYLPKGGSHVSF
jgi:tRNA1Val (adenine37-N6)-methyltransferase